ncbi:MAG: hypothetical protein M3527_04515 [Actinomycetota bacterium]|nr:hypothetical protein [Acidimicrobiia bacterium]MDQ3293697.1 hypothetical protein [Actinomycetota bacterium]
MTGARVRVIDLRDHAVPDLCFKSGQPAEQWVPVVATRRVSPVWLLMGVVPWFIATAVAAKVTVDVPASSEVVDALRRRTSVAVGLATLAVAVGALGMVFDEIVVGLVAGLALLLVSGVMLGLARAGWVDAVLVDGGDIELRGVDPDVAIELDRRYAGH